jgi:hypothetical protein
VWPGLTSQREPGNRLWRGLLKSGAAFAAGPLLLGLRIKVAVLLFKVNSAANNNCGGRKKSPLWAAL